MSRFRIFALLLVPLLASPLLASDPTGIYGIIEEIVLDPSAEQPERARIHGAFSVSEGKHGDHYSAPRWGFLYVSLPEGDQREPALAEWADLAKAAGTGKVVAFGSRYWMHKAGGLEVHPSDAEPRTPSEYPMGYGLRVIEHNRTWNVSRLLSLPRPVTPTKGDAVEAETRHRRGQDLELVARNPIGTTKDTRVLFEIETGAGEILASEPVEPGEKETRWTAHVYLTPGQTVKWRVRIIDPGLKYFSVAEATFVVAAKKKAAE